MAQLTGQFELVRQALSAVVAEHFAEEVDLFPALWSWWTQNRAGWSVGSSPMADGLPALGSAREGGYSGMLILAFAAIISEWPTGEKMPSEASVEDALRAAAPQLGLRGRRLDRIVRASTSRLCSVLKRMEHPLPAGDAAPTATGIVWVEQLRNGVRVPAVGRDMARLESTAKAADVDLPVDEIHERVLGRQRTMTFGDFKPRELVALWLVLHYSGASFGQQQIEKARFPGGEDPAGRRKYPIMARNVLKGLVGKEVLGRGKRERYYVPSDGWSWAWYRSSEDALRSHLLAQPGIPVDRR